MPNNKSYSKRYQEYLEYKGTSDSTIRTYLSAIRNYPIHSIVEKSVKNNRGLHHYLNKKIANLYVEKKLSTKYIQKIVAAYKSYIKFLQWNGSDIIVHWNAITYPKSRKKKEKDSATILSNAEIIKIIQSSKNSTQKLIVSLGYWFALRISELCALSVDDFSQNYTKVRISGVKHGKTIEYPVPPQISHLIRTARPFGKIINTSRTNINNLWHDACKRAGLQETIRFHILRHSRIHHQAGGIGKAKLARTNISSFKTDLTDEEKEKLKSVGRHKNLRTTDTYSHIEEI